MANRPNLPVLRRPRFWIGVPAAVLILADATLTLIFQPASYWSVNYAYRMETSPLGSTILSQHPALFAAFILLWLLIAVLLLARLPEPWKRAVALAIIVGHTAGIYGWLVLRNYWYTIPIFVLVGILTTVCWQRAESLRPL